MSTSERKRRAVFFDRDGVLNALVTRDGVGVSPRRRADFVLVDGVREAVERVRRLGLLAFVVTNQPDVARGHMSADELAAMHDALRAVVNIDEVVACLHDDGDACDCRKPKPGMLRDLARRWNVELGGSIVIGDSWKDIVAGRDAGCRTIHVRHLGGAALDVPGDAEVGSLAEAVRQVEAWVTGESE